MHIHQRIGDTDRRLSDAESRDRLVPTLTTCRLEPGPGFRGISAEKEVAIDSSEATPSRALKKRRGSGSVRLDRPAALVAAGHHHQAENAGRQDERE